MSEEIQIKKSMVWSIAGVVIIGLFIVFALSNARGSKNDGNQELVQGGEVGANKVIIEGDAQIVNLGIAHYNYDPNTITVKAGKAVKIIGNMNQLQGCLRAFRIPQLGISKIFSTGDNILEFIPSQKGTYGFSCSMGMGRGTLIVE